MTFIKYCLILERENQETALDLTANDGSHAQAQASDIARAMKADAFSLTYEQIAPCELSELFRKLAYSDFPKKVCCPWEGSYTNGTPAIYALKRRYYVRRLVQDYLNIDRDVFVMNSCRRKNCINPFHNSYKNMKASKTTGADKDLALAFASQGVPVKEIAKALKVHTSTVYRILKNERFHSWTQS